MADTFEPTPLFWVLYVLALLLGYKIWASHPSRLFSAVQSAMQPSLDFGLAMAQLAICLLGLVLSALCPPDAVERPIIRHVKPAKAPEYSVPWWDDQHPMWVVIDRSRAERETAASEAAKVKAQREARMRADEQWAIDRHNERVYRARRLRAEQRASEVVGPLQYLWLQQTLRHQLAQQQSSWLHQSALPLFILRAQQHQHQHQQPPPPSPAKPSPPTPQLPDDVLAAAGLYRDADGSVKQLAKKPALLKPAAPDAKAQPLSDSGVKRNTVNRPSSLVML
ncbi:hypothetical protein B0A48_10464 [Cryoendolithus antarcticus]|uniref:Uncharacterized protein n=1 Tax=Cryoendolithus antarcticus TaxID=1507870 RepID=A0A1V8SXD4_9PEZI|nr:hypothetical protein B0A48_10464 [Cryoendolithus antarcticus]